MDKELPTSGSGRSAFTVFGFGSTDRYNANFDSTLETPANVESFNATDSIAFPSRPTVKSKKKTSSTDDTVEAYKMRISAAGGDGSRLVLQSLVPSSSVSARTSESPGLVSASSKLVGRRYSGAQNNQARGDISGDVAGMPGTHSDQLLQMFSSSLQTSPHPRLPDLPAVSATGPMSGSSADGLTNSTGGMRRQGSSPVLSSMAHQKGSLVQGYLRRRASSSALSSVSESGVDNSVVATTSSSSSSSSSKTTPSSVVAVVRDTDADTSGELVKKSRAITPAVQTSSLSKDSSVDATDAHGSKGKGYGILNSTRRFGAWLGKVTHGEKMEVSKKDLNVFAPTSF